MKKLLQLIFGLIVTISISLQSFAQTIPDDKLYLGQTPPDNISKIFILPLTSGLRPVERIAITSDGKEIYFSELNAYPPSTSKIQSLKYYGSSWQGPNIVFDGYAAPRLSVDGNIMYMQKNSNGVAVTYFSRRNSSGWSTPERLLSTNVQSHYFQNTSLGNSYMSSILSSANGSDICQVITVNSNTTVQSLGKPINTKDQENDFFIAKDESFIIIARNPQGAGGDLYITYKKSDGKWTNPKSLGGQVNTSGNWEYGPFVTNDNKYLFFTRGGAAMSTYATYWIKIDNIIEDLRHTNYSPYLKNQIPTIKTNIGSIFSYTIPDTTFYDDDQNNTLVYSATMYDDTPLPAWLSFNTATRTFFGTPVSPGTIYLKVTAKDEANDSTMCSFSINVSSTIGIGKDDEQLPKSVNLNQNYPNPFNPSTTISFYIPTQELVTLKILDILGREVSVLINKELNAGEHSVNFHSQNLASGLYLYRLQAGKYIQNRKMVILK
jgi:hypothetical protein